MTTITVHLAETGKAAVANPFFAKVEKALQAVRRRAFELFEKRGGAPGGELGDWFQAEQELFFVPQAEMTEDGRGFTMKMETPGFAAADMEVIALPREIFVEAKAGKRDATSTETKCLYRRFELSAPIDALKVHAALDRGQLVIEAPKKLVDAIPVQAAGA
jgi:HSP20 family molecular chaperone IbpA